MRLLLHTCCLPCAIYPIDLAEQEKIAVTGFFYNPNIHPHAELLKRYAECDKYFKPKNLESLFPEQSEQDFFKKISGIETPSSRCITCWRMRLSRTAVFAKENGYDAFSTTLLGSPYQDHGTIKNISEELSKDFDVNFYYRDLRKGFNNAHKVARSSGIYCQNYCGCIFSIMEREEKKLKK